MSILNIGSYIPNHAVFKASIIFSVIKLDEIKLITTLKIKLIDLFGSFGIFFLSSSKNFFNPLFINLVVIYVAIYSIAKFTNTTPTLYFMFCLNTSTYCSPISRVCKYFPLTVIAT